MAKKRRTRERRAGVLRWTLRIVLLLVIADLIYLAYLWPDWERLANGPVPKSNFIAQYEERRQEKGWPRLHWQPVSLSEIPKHLQRAVLLGEDIRFYQHSGFDFIALKEAMDYNLEKGELAVGGSTISQQTVKNLFLSPSRNPIRKWHEIVLTWALERNLSKRRILEIYLNTAEFGRGIYGVQAASLAYWGVPVRELTVIQSAELIASLPSPIKNNPANRTKTFSRRSQKLLNLLARQYPIPDEAVDAGAGTLPALPQELPPVPTSPPAEDIFQDSVRTI